MKLKDLSTGAEEDLEDKGMKLVMDTCASLVLVQPCSVVLKHSRASLMATHCQIMSTWAQSLTQGSWGNLIV